MSRSFGRVPGTRLAAGILLRDKVTMQRPTGLFPLQVAPFAVAFPGGRHQPLRAPPSYPSESIPLAEPQLVLRADRNDSRSVSSSQASGVIFSARTSRPPLRNQGDAGCSGSAYTEVCRAPSFRQRPRPLSRCPPAAGLINQPLPSRPRVRAGAHAGSCCRHELPWAAGPMALGERPQPFLPSAPRSGGSEVH